MVGDTEGDCSAALAVGYEFIEARYGYGEFKHKNKLVADTLSDVWKIVNRSLMLKNGHQKSSQIL